jgi:hypothetical protein
MSSPCCLPAGIASNFLTARLARQSSRKELTLMKLHMDTFRRLRFGVDLIAGLPEYDRRRADAHDGLIVLANSTGDAGDRFAAGLALIVALDGWNRILDANGQGVGKWEVVD